jgi:hypothetical protein
MRNPLSATLILALAASVLLILFIGMVGYLPGPSLEEEQRHHEELQEKCKANLARCFAKDAAAALEKALQRLKEQRAKTGRLPPQDTTGPEKKR